MNDEIRYGTCPSCKSEGRFLYFALGLNKGEIWSGYICERCLNEHGAFPPKNRGETE